MKRRPHLSAFVRLYAATTTNQRRQILTRGLRKSFLARYGLVTIFLLTLSFFINVASAQSPPVDEPHVPVYTAAATQNKILEGPDGASYFFFADYYANKIGRKSGAVYNNSWATVGGNIQDAVIGQDGAIYILIIPTTAGQTPKIARVTFDSVVNNSWADLGTVSNSWTNMIQAPNGNFYVTNNTTKMLKVAPTNTAFGTMGVVTLFATSTYRNLNRMAADDNSNVYCTNTNDSVITKITQAGLVNDQWAKPRQAQSSFFSDIVYFAGNIYLADNYPDVTTIGKFGIHRINVADSTLTNRWAEVPAAASDYCGGFVLSTNGNLYVTSGQSSVVYKISTTTGTVSSFVALSTTGIGSGYKGTKLFATPDYLYQIRSKFGMFLMNSYLISRIGTTPFSVTINQTNATCASTPDGGARAIASGCSVGAYTYLWSPGGATTDTISNLAPGTYTVRVICSGDTVNKSVTIGTTTVIAAPATSSQTFCAGSAYTVADLTASGTNIQWYAFATGGSPLASTTPLTDSMVYYASQTITGCESGTRAKDTVFIRGQLKPTADTAFCNSNSSVSIAIKGNANNITWTATQSGTGIAASGNGSNISFIANNTSNTVKTDTVVVSASYTTPSSYAISNGTYALADTTGSAYLNLSTEYGSGNLSTAKAIGFPFNFFGNGYSNFYISNIGSITFDAGTNPTKIIYGQMRGLWKTNASSRIAYKVSGTAPNRKLIVSFINLQKPADYSGTVFLGVPMMQTHTFTANPSAGTGSFQIVLNEGSNSIESGKGSVPSLTESINPDPYNQSGTVGGAYEGIKDGSNAYYVSGRNNGSWINLSNELKIFTPQPGLSCPLQRDTFCVSVLPTPKVDSVPAAMACPGSSVTAINFSTPITGGAVYYKWSNNNTSIGLAASGNGSIASFTASSSPATATVTVMPYMMKGADTCFGTPRSFTITSGQPAAPVTSSLVIYTGSKALNQLNVNSSNVQFYNSATGGAALPGTTAVQDDSDYYISQSIGGCESSRTKIVVNRISNDSLVKCGAGTIADIITAPNTGDTIRWYRSALSATVLPGTTSLMSGLDTLYVAEAASNRVPVITITNPTPVINTTADKVVCNNSTVGAINFSTPTTGGLVSYAWTNDNPSIGLAASGTGDITSFSSVNTSATKADTATIIVTPTITNAGLSCTGIKDTFYIVINPAAQVNTVANKVVCNSAGTGAINFSTNNSGGATSYAWTNNNTAIGLASSGNGVIASFTASNNTTAPLSATVTVTPIFTNGSVGCTGAGSSFLITVNPTATVNAILNQTVCNGSSVSAVNFGSSATGVAISYPRTNNNATIGLAASGSGNIASFNGTNSGTAPDSATITVTPTFTANGVSCTGTARAFKIYVNPTATVINVPNQVLCNGAATTAINFGSSASGGTISYVWMNNNSSLGLAASGSGNIASFNAINNGNAPVTATITVTSTYSFNGVSCTGTSRIFTITVNPTTSVSAISNQVVCNGAPTTAVAFGTSASGGSVSYTWTNNNPSIGLAASGSGNIASFNATNNSTVPVTATITVMPMYSNGGTSCTGISRSFSITVNPTAAINQGTDQVLCNGSAASAIAFSSSNSGGTMSYAWTNDNPAIGLAANGSGTIASFVAVNNGTAPDSAVIIVSPTFSNGGATCAGIADTLVVIVNPTPVVNAVINQVICNNAPSPAVLFSTPNTGGNKLYTWTNSNPAIGLAASGSGNIALFTAINNSNAPINSTITINMTYTYAGVSCTSAPKTFTYTVNPTATVNAILNQTVCNGSSVTAINFTSPTTGGNVSYTWTNDKPSIGLAANGGGNMASFNAVNNGNTPVTATIVVTPTFSNGGTSCTGTPRSFTITINPTAVVNVVSNQTVCAGTAVSAVTFSGPVLGTTYAWTNSNPSIGSAAIGSGNIVSFNSINPSPNAATGTITVTPNTVAGCVGQPTSYVVTVNGLSVAPTSISNPTPIVCANNAFANLTVAGGALGSGASWKWYADSLNTPSIGNGTTLSNIAVGKTTTYFVRAEGTCNNTAAVGVIVQRANLVMHVRQHWNDVLLFDNSSKNYVAWQWYKNGTLVPGATMQQYSEGSALAGAYYVAATDKNGIQEMSCPLMVTAGSFTGLRISLFPNPVDNSNNVTISTSFTQVELGGATIIVSDVYGRVIRTMQQIPPTMTMQAPTATGMYIITLTLQNGVKYSANLLSK